MSGESYIDIMPDKEDTRDRPPAAQEDLAAAQAELATARAVLAAARAEATALASELEALRASTSWRVTKPLRATGRLLGRLRGQRGVESEPRRPRPVTAYPAIYGFVEHIAACSGCRYVIELGCGGAKGLTSMYPRFEPVGVDSRKIVDRCKRRYRFGEWVSTDLGAGPLVIPDRSRLAESVVVVAGTFSRLATPDHLVVTLCDLLHDAPYAVVADVAQESIELLEEAGLEVMFEGLTVAAARDPRKDAVVAVIRRSRPALTPPPDFRVTALIYAYNEEDVIASTIEHLIGQGLHVHLIDNWSTDRTAEIARRYSSSDACAVTTFPEDGPTGVYDSHRLLRHVESLARQIDTSWIVRLDADEIRESPWPGVSLREALYRVDCEGYNAIDHTVLEFRPTVGGAVAGTPVYDRMRYFEFGKRPGHFSQIRAWKQQPGPIELADSGGHEVGFPGRRVYPFKFLLRHYSVRSQEHGERKVLLERAQRVSRFAREVRGWHTHYDEMTEHPSFLRRQDELLRFDDETFYREYVIERLSGVDIVRRERGAR